MVIDNPVQPKMEPNQPPPESTIHAKGEAPVSPIADAAAAAYAPRTKAENAVFKPGEDKPSVLQRVADGSDATVKKDVDNLLASGGADVEKKDGTWSEESKAGWKKLVDDLKASGMSPGDIASALNKVGAAINRIHPDAPNHVGIALKPEANGASSVYMLLDGPNAGAAQNGLDALTGHESGSVIKAGTLGGPPEQHI